MNSGDLKAARIKFALEMLAAGEKKKQSLRMPSPSREHVMAFNKNNLILSRHRRCQSAVGPGELIEGHEDYSLRELGVAHDLIMAEKKDFSATGSMCGPGEGAVSKVSWAREDRRWAPIGLPRASWVRAAPI